MPIITETLYGSRAAENVPLYNLQDEFQFMSSDGKTGFSLSEEILSRGLLCIGGTGSGKTNTINQLVSQIKARMTDNDVMIVFDTKGDFYENFYSSSDKVIGNSKQFRSISERWNVFCEAAVDGEDDDSIVVNINDLCRCLFKKYESSSQPFFSNAGRGLVAAVMLYMMREKRDGGGTNEQICNMDLVDWFERSLADDYKQMVQKYSDLSNVNLYLGVFGEAGDFSLREFVRKKGGRTLFIEYDMAIGEALSQVYSLLLDLALKEALGRQEKIERGNVYVIIDEFKLLPNLTHSDDAVNFGRSMGLKVAAGLQSMAQLYDVYGKDKGRSIAAGCSSVMAFRSNDWLTTEYVRDAFGLNYLSETTLAGSLPSTERREGHVVEAWEVSKLKPGEAFIRIIENSPFKFKFKEYER